MCHPDILKIGNYGVVEKPYWGGLFKDPKGHANVQMQGAQKTELRSVYGYTLSGAVCSATQQMRRALQGMSVL